MDEIDKFNEMVSDNISFLESIGNMRCIYRKYSKSEISGYKYVDGSLFFQKVGMKVIQCLKKELNNLWG